MNEQNHIDECARVAYQIYCEQLGVEPEWGRGGYKTQVVVWRSIAQAVINEDRNTLKTLE